MARGTPVFLCSFPWIAGSFSLIVLLPVPSGCVAAGDPNFNTPPAFFTVSQHFNLGPDDESGSRVDAPDNGNKTGSLGGTPGNPLPPSSEKDDDQLSSSSALSEEKDLDDSTSDPPVVASSILFNGGYVFSVNGGAAESCFSIEATMLNEEDETYDDDDDESDSDNADDNDDDDDGHSSMLSNASLRRSRSRIHANGGGGGAGAGGGSGGGSVEHETRSHDERTCLSSNDRSAPVGETLDLFTADGALSVRGGAAAMDLGSEFAKRLVVAALVTLLYEACLGHFLEFVKVVIQTSPPGTSYADVVRTIIRNKGIAGIWDGFVPWGVIQSIFKGGVFGLAHAMALSTLSPLVDEGRIPKQLALTVAGGIAGGFQGYALSPTLLLKTRVMTNPVFRESMSIVRTTALSMRIGMEVVRNEGILALMKGSNIFATKRVFDWSTRYYFGDVFGGLIRSQRGGGPLSAVEKICASLLAGTASTLVTLPLDVLVSKSQDAKKAGVKVTAWKLFLDDLNEKGFVGVCRAYMSSFEVRLAHVCFTTVAMQVGNPFAYRLLFSPRSHASTTAT